MVDFTTGGLVHEIIYARPLAETGIEDHALSTGLFGPVGLISKDALQSIQL